MAAALRSFALFGCSAAAAENCAEGALCTLMRAIRASATLRDAAATMARRHHRSPTRASCSHSRRSPCARGVRPLSCARDSAAAGLFGIEGLHSPRDFVSLAHQAQRACQHLVHSIESSPAPSALTLHHMDELSEQLCRVMDAAELCRNVHPAQEWRDASMEVYAQLAGYIQHLNSNQGLHMALASLMATPNRAIWETLSEEERVLGQQLLMDMERNGVHLRAAERERFAELQAELVQLSSTFMANMAQQTSAVPLPAEQVTTLPAAIRQLLRRWTAADGDPAAVAVLPCDRATTNTVLKWSNDEELRRRVYNSHYSGAAANLPVLARILDARAELAQLMGYASYAEYTATGNMVGSTQNIDNFLEELLRHVQPKAEAELQLLLRAQQSRRNAATPVADDNILLPWNKSCKPPPPNPRPPQRSATVRAP
jgi:intermediate peptidase